MITIVFICVCFLPAHRWLITIRERVFFTYRIAGVDYFLSCQNKKGKKDKLSFFFYSWRQLIPSVQYKMYLFIF